MERKLRADETYRREIVDTETKGLYNQINDLESQIISYNTEILKLKSNNSQLKDWANSATILKENALTQARENSANVDRLEKDNSEVKQRLYQIEIEYSKMKMKNEILKERLAAVPDLRMGTAGHPNHGSSKSSGKGKGPMQLQHEAQQMRQNQHEYQLQHQSNHPHSRITRESKRNNTNTSTSTNGNSRSGAAHAGGVLMMGGGGRGTQGHNHGHMGGGAYGTPMPMPMPIDGSMNMNIQENSLSALSSITGFDGSMMRKHYG